MYVITVDFEIDPARIEEFLPLMKANAASSVSGGPRSASRLLLVG